jgi:hypothetical protein
MTKTNSTPKATSMAKPLTQTPLDKKPWLCYAGVKAKTDREPLPTTNQEKGKNMTVHLSVPYSLFKVQNDFHREVLLLIAGLKPSDPSSDLQKSLDRIMQLSDLLLIEWQKAHPVINQKELSHLSIQTGTSQPISN